MACRATPPGRSGTITTITYDALGRVTKIVDGPGQGSLTTYEVIDGVARRVDPPGPPPPDEAPPDEPFVVE